MDETQWIRMVQEKDSRSAFKGIFQKYYKRLHGFAYNYVGDIQEAEDVVQTVFLRMWEQRNNWESSVPLKNYLFSAVRNEALNVIRHRQVVSDSEREVIRIFRELGTETSVEDDQDVLGLQQEIERAFDALPSRCREIFTLSRRGGLTYPEIANVLGISVNTVSTQMGRALKHFRDHLSYYLCLPATATLSTMLLHAFYFLLLFFAV